MSRFFQIRKPFDGHHHLRDNEMLRNVAGFLRHYSSAIVMPNLELPILNGADVRLYFQRIEKSFASAKVNCTPLMTVQIVPGSNVAMVESAFKAGAIAAKIYPKYRTPEPYGVTNYNVLRPIFEFMQKRGMRLLLHGESCGEKHNVRDKEHHFMKTVRSIAQEFPKLYITLEHITTAEAVEAIKELPNVYATITVHHLLLTENDILDGKIRPGNYCAPIAKTFEDREALLIAATSGNPKFFFGSDSAPHHKDKKYCEEGCAGIFSSPCALPLLTEIFNSRNALSRLENFVSVFGPQFYGFDPSEQKITLRNSPWQMDEEIHGVIPFKAGEVIDWAVIEENLR